MGYGGAGGSGLARNVWRGNHGEERQGCMSSTLDPTGDLVIFHPRKVNIFSITSAACGLGNGGACTALTAAIHTGSMSAQSLCWAAPLSLPTL